MKISTKRLVTDAMLIAMYVVISLTLTINLGDMKITLDSLPIIVGAMLFGPFDGMMIGLLGSFINQLISYGFSPTTILWVIPAAMRGLLIGAYAKKKNFNLTLAETVFITVSTAIITTVLNTVAMYLDSKIFGYFTYAYVFGKIIPRFISGIIIAVIYGFIMPKLIKPLRKIAGTK